MGTTPSIHIDAATRALQRAYEGDCHRHLSAIEADEHGAAAIYHKADSFYVVTLAGCSCKGSLFGHLCRHQLALADRVGLLDRFIPGVYDHPATAAIAA